MCFQNQERVQNGSLLLPCGILSGLRQNLPRKLPGQCSDLERVLQAAEGCWHEQGELACCTVELSGNRSMQLSERVERRSNRSHSSGVSDDRHPLLCPTKIYPGANAASYPMCVDLCSCDLRKNQYSMASTVHVPRSLLFQAFFAVDWNALL